MDNICPICNKEKPKPKNKYCSYACRNIYINSIKDYSKQTDKIRKTKRENLIKKNGELKTFQVICKNCKSIYEVLERSKRFPIKSKYFCSRSCAVKFRGPRSEEIKEKIRQKLKRLPKERICRGCHKYFIPIINGRKSNGRVFCSQPCNYRHRRENINIKNLYRTYSNFDFPLNRYPEHFNFKLIEEHGWYKAKNNGNNLSGISRDHLFSISDGFKRLINPKILSHPANCELKIHNTNISKGSKSSITLDHLLEKIKHWTAKYSEDFSISEIFITLDQLKICQY